MRALLLSLAIVAAAATPAEAQVPNELIAVLDTTKGDIYIQLFPDLAPVTVASFANLAQRGYYDGLKFHRVIANFMIQGGDPLGNGRGGPGYRFEDEFSPALRHDGPGILSMANSGPRTNGSQFFITHVATPHLDDKHSVFGKVLKGQKVVNAIEQNDMINAMVIIGDTTGLYTAQGENITKWNDTIRESYPGKASAMAAAKLAEVQAKCSDFANKCARNREGFAGAKEKADEKKREQAANDELKQKAAELAKQGLEPQIEAAKELLKSHEVDLSRARQTESGMWIVPLVDGEGAMPQPTSKVKVHYTGYLVTGAKFDSSEDRGTPAQFGLNQVIKGWTEGVGQMKVGSSCILVIPPELGYGSRGVPRAGIPANGVLVFKVDLLEIMSQ